jgi:hypothetical protein
MVGFFAALHLLVLGGMMVGMSPGVAPAVVLLSVVPVYLSATYLMRAFGRPLSWLDIAVLLFASWSVASVALYFQAGNPTGTAAYAHGLYHFVLPIACYFAVKRIHPSQHQRLVGALVMLNAFAMVIGLYMHFVRPAFYTEFLHQALASQGATEEWQYFARMQSYLGSTSVGYMGAASLVLITLASASVRRLSAPLSLVFLVSAALSLQRASLVAVALGFAYLAFAFRGQAWLRVLTIGTIVGAGCYGMAKLEETGNPFKETLESRATTELADGLSAFMTERGYGRGFRYLRSFPLGVGIGGTSSAADNAGLVSRGEVHDANFMRIAADLGVLGLLLFLGLLGVAAWRAATSRHPLAWLTFLVIHCGIMLSTNVFDSYYVSHSFWLLLAVIDGDREPMRVQKRAADLPVIPTAAAYA